MNAKTVDREKLKELLRPYVKEALGSLMNPKFDAFRIKSLLEKYGEILVFANNKHLSLTQDDLPEIKKAIKTHEKTFYAPDEDGAEDEVFFDQIEFVEAGGKRIAEVKSADGSVDHDELCKCGDPRWKHLHDGKCRNSACPCPEFTPKKQEKVDGN